MLQTNATTNIKGGDTLRTDATTNTHAGFLYFEGSVHILCNQVLPNSSPPCKQDHHGPDPPNPPINEYIILLHLSSIMLQKNDKTKLEFGTYNRSEVCHDWWAA